MILKIKQWCEGIVVAIIISIIIEMLLPDGKNKKYVKVIIGIYIMFVVLSPILEIINYDINLDDFFDFESVQASSSNLEIDMKDVYVVGIQEQIKKDLEEIGYKIEEVEVYVDINYENIEKIELKGVQKTGQIGMVEPIIIGNGDKQSDFKYTHIIEYLKENYSVSEEKIIFK